MNRTALLVACVVAVSIAAPLCAETRYYLVDAIAEKSSQPTTRAEARELEKIYHDLEQASGVDAKLVWSTDPDINAFATEVGGEKIVVVQEGLLETLNGDRDAVAATLGHELGHHKADHIRAGKRKQQGARVLGGILGAVIGAKIGHGGGAVAGAAVGGIGGSLVALKFSRDQEIEADRLSVGWMIAAGYNPQGMLRLQQHLGELEGHSHAAIFSTHPSSAKRYQAAQQQIAKLAPPADLLARSAQPLVGTDALAAASSEIRHADEARIAQALKPSTEPVAAEALAPVGKITFDAYAALENALLYAGAQGRARLLAKNHVSEAQYAQLAKTFSARMAANPALSQRYKVEFFRATQGRFSAWGRDLADSYEKGQALQLDPPYPLDTAGDLFAQMRERGAPELDAAQQQAAEATVLKPFGLTYYDFLIGHNWWTRQGRIGILVGDAGVLRAYYAIVATPADAAATAGVHVGNDVRVGGNVRIGGHAAAVAPAKHDED